MVSDSLTGQDEQGTWLWAAGLPGAPLTKPKKPQGAGHTGFVL